MPHHVSLKGAPGLGLPGLHDLIAKNLDRKGKGFVILHAGANDIGRVEEKAWLNLLECLLCFIEVGYPGYTVVWSDMLPRNIWRHIPKDVKEKVKDPKKRLLIMEGMRKRLNRRARLMCQKKGGTIVNHPSLQKNFSLLSPKDGVHLTQQGQADLWGDFFNFIHNI